jgi:hypothetical protein
MEAFLHYWNTHDTMIIQSLVVFILFLVIFLAVRLLFGKDKQELETSHGKSEGVALSAGATEEIEKTLMRILENQNQAQLGQRPVLGVEGEKGLVNAGVSAVEVANLQVEVKKREDKISNLERQLEQVQTELTNQPKAGLAVDAVVLQEKMKTLESRLSEYEIISEDIADLSFYKEENTRLQKELAKVQAGAGAPSTQPAAGPAQEAPASVQSVVVEEKPAPQAAEGGIDDDIMAQFAAAVDEQKAASAAAKAVKASGSAEAAKPPVDGELIGKFEEFVKKG